MKFEPSVEFNNDLPWVICFGFIPSCPIDLETPAAIHNLSWGYPAAALEVIGFTDIINLNILNYFRRLSSKQFFGKILARILLSEKYR
jgi:hypothetical protein